jgi:hypothetical protein
MFSVMSCLYVEFLSYIVFAYFFINISSACVEVKCQNLLFYWYVLCYVLLTKPDSVYILDLITVMQVVKR